jgi:hypothetical protein
MYDSHHEDENQTTFICSKYGQRMPEASAACKDPKLYCKFRTSCLIHFMEKQRRAPAAVSACSKS